MANEETVLTPDNFEEYGINGIKQMSSLVKKRENELEKLFELQEKLAQLKEKRKAIEKQISDNKKETKQTKKNIRNFARSIKVSKNSIITLVNDGASDKEISVSNKPYAKTRKEKRA